MSLTITAASRGEFQRELARKGAKMQAAAASALYTEAESIMSDSRPLVPWETGTLKGSGFVNRPEGSGTSVSVTLGFGGSASAYALVQHEREDFNHPRGGQAKYLETAVDQHAATFDERMAAHVRRAL